MSTIEDIKKCIIADISTDLQSVLDTKLRSYVDSIISNGVNDVKNKLVSEPQYTYGPEIFDYSNHSIFKDFMDNEGCSYDKVFPVFITGCNEYDYMKESAKIQVEIDKKLLIDPDYYANGRVAKPGAYRYTHISDGQNNHRGHNIPVQSNKICDKCTNTNCGSVIGTYYSHSYGNISIIFSNTNILCIHFLYMIHNCKNNIVVYKYIISHDIYELHDCKYIVRDDCIYKIRDMNYGGNPGNSPYTPHNKYNFDLPFQTTGKELTLKELYDIASESQQYLMPVRLIEQQKVSYSKELIEHYFAKYYTEEAVCTDYRYKENLKIVEDISIREANIKITEGELSDRQDTLEKERDIFEQYCREQRKHIDSERDTLLLRNKNLKLQELNVRTSAQKYTDIENIHKKYDQLLDICAKIWNSVDQNDKNIPHEIKYALSEFEMSIRYKTDK